MADRLASYSDIQDYLKDGASISSESDKGTALGMALDKVSRRMMTYILKGPTYTLRQYTSDGVSGPTEFYGVEHYGLHKRNLIRLARPFNLVSVTAVIDNGTTLDSSQWVLDPRVGTIHRLTGRFAGFPQAVQVIYTSGWPTTGAGDMTKLAVPDDLTEGCCKQVTYEFTRREPGGVPVGATTISRPDGSVVTKAGVWLDDVLDTMKQYRR